MKRFFQAAAAVVIVAGAAIAVPSAKAEGLRLFDFKPGAFANVVTSGSAHYHLAYTVKNRGDEARKPSIRIELRTETDKTYGDHFHAPTYTAASEDARRKEPYKSTSQIRRADLDGGASAEGLAHFGRIDPNADEFEVRVYGLWDPIVRTTKGTFAERRVLVLKYRRSGDEYNRQDDPIELTSQAEVLEGEPTLLHSGQ